MRPPVERTPACAGGRRELAAVLTERGSGPPIRDDGKEQVVELVVSAGRAQVQSRSVVPVLVEDLLGKRDRDLGALPGRVSLARVEEAAPQVADLQPRPRRQERRGDAQMQSRRS